jgi:hypothetical protein
VAAIALCCVWTMSLFRATSSEYLPWHRSVLTAPEITRTDIRMFQGKRLSKQYYDFYDQVFGVLSKFDHSYYVVNYSWDPLLVVLTDLKRAQLMPFYLEPPFYLPFAEYGYHDEPRKIQQLIASRKAIIFTAKEQAIPGYEVVFDKPWSSDTPWFAQFPGMRLRISVPVGSYRPLKQPS